VVQYNKRDLARSFDIESLHRKLDLPDAAVFEAVASEGAGVLQTLTTVSKRVVRILSERDSEPTAPSPTQAVGALETIETPSSAARVGRDTKLEDAILQEGEEANAEANRIAELTLRKAQNALDRPWSELEKEAVASEGFRLDADLRIVGVGAPTIAGERSVRVPLTLGNPSGERAQLSLTITLDPLLDSDG
jgi:hypothetical protein